MKREKTNLVPKLRFPAFRDADGWSEQFGDNLFKQISDKNPEPGLPVLAITQEYGAIPRHMIDYHVSVSEKSIESYKVVQVGDFIISLRSFQGGIEYSQYKGICSPAYVILRRRGQGNDAYFRHYLKTDRFIQILTKNLEGLRDGKMISYKQFSELRIPVPSPEEQKKIADCLSSLDELIAAQARKVDALKTHKKGLMQQLFPREGETQPRLRFPDFRGAGEWELRKLEDLAKRGSGHTPSKSSSEYYDGGIKWVSLADSKHLDAGLISTTKIEISKQGIENSSAVLHPAGTVLISRDAGVGKSAVMAVPMAVSQHFIVWVCDDQKLVNWFLYYLLQLMKPIFERIATGSTIKTIGLPFFKELCISVPPLREQQRIADCLISLDALLTTTNQELDTLKTHKKGLMQQLFPSVEAVEG
ncbi:restriction endonuclease subunit S [Rhodoferax sp. U2-2l]|uniref:restriction endonuclease subunit S n=1 Tax=Rhodoferax sp. U2-2l TaxID=2884000 RepID=UPI001D0B4002|nr:restriction endonuclease subunit S [Rhodoferax sp. U2-2l]MCB8747514.1 restriction endonuclease subunit S [Rhodoferax sp. U2-2l]